VACGVVAAAAVRLASDEVAGEAEGKKKGGGEAWERQACDLSTWAACLPSEGASGSGRVGSLGGAHAFFFPCGKCPWAALAGADRAAGGRGVYCTRAAQLQWCCRAGMGAESQDQSRYSTSQNIISQRVQIFH
jgi:hypothetical protein